jgi:hypothetical protein
MQGCISPLVSLVQDSHDFDFGTREACEFKVLTPEGRIEIEVDTSYDRLVKLANLFAGGASI